MAIPFFICQSAGPAVRTLDDPTVWLDGCAANGTGGSAFAAYVLSAPFDGPSDAEWNRLRRVDQTVEHEGSATVAVTPYVEGAESGQAITRNLTPTSSPHVEAPFAVGGSRFQVKIAVSVFDADVRLGKAKFWLIGRRTDR